MILFDSDRFHEIFETLGRNRSRTLLTGFGVFWGIFMLLALMGGGQGLKISLELTLDGFATNSGFLIPNETSKPYKGFRSGRSWDVDLKDIEILRRRIPEIDAITGNITAWGATAVYEDRTANCQGRGVLPEYMKIETPRLQYGRYINPVDVAMERKVCVIGKYVYKQLFPEGGDPCGKYIRFNDIWYQIVGVDFASGNISINGSADRAVTMPMSLMQKMYNRGNQVDVLCITAREGYKIKDILREAKVILAREHYIDPGDKQAIIEINTEELFSIVDNLFKGISILIWLVGFGTLLAAAIGVSNIMMVTVRERTTEIGIRRAIGATPRMILTQIMLESVILTVAAGLLGIVFAVLVLSLADMMVSHSDMAGVTFQVSFASGMAALGILTLLGLAAGIAPAQRAMEIKPVDAMRDE